jgi:hypothetical protein
LDHHNSFATIDDPNWGHHPTALPVIASDFKFATRSGRRVHKLASLPDHNMVVSSFCFRKQKNNDNGQTLMYHHRLGSHWMCPIQASLNIVQCTQYLDTPYNHLAAVYQDPHTDLRRLIASSQVAVFLRQVVHKVFDIPVGHKTSLHGPATPSTSQPRTSSILPSSLTLISRTAYIDAATPF